MCAKNRRWGLEPIQTCHSGANHAGLHAQNVRWGLGHSDLLFWSKTRCFAFKNHRWGLGPRETCYSGPKVAVLHPKTTDEGWNPYRLVIPVQITLDCMQKTADEDWDPERHVILVQKSLFCLQKPQMRAGTHRDLLFWSKSRYFASKNHRWGLGPLETSFSGDNHAVFRSQNDMWGLEPIETCNYGPKAAVLHAKTTDEGWDP